MLGAGGVMAIETKVAAVTLSVTGFDVTDPEAAVMVVLPAVREVATPFDPGALLTEATPPEEETQVADSVRS
jgi:hypothetical protein